jgi:hypothetical protein
MSEGRAIKPSMTREEAKALIGQKYDIQMPYLERLEPNTGFRRLAEAFISSLMHNSIGMVKATPNIDADKA